MLQSQLKRIKNFFQSKNETFILLKNSTILHIGHIDNQKENKVQLEPRYNLKHYKIVINEKEKKSFFLEPEPEGRKLGLEKVQLVAAHPEERARWFLAL